MFLNLAFIKKKKKEKLPNFDLILFCFLLVIV